MAELLVNAQDSYMDKLDTAKLSDQDFRRYQNRLKKGDVICVKPDGWKWGKKECLPQFVVVKLTGVAVEDVKHYEEYNGDIAVGYLDKKYSFDSVKIDTAITNKSSLMSVLSTDIKEKTQWQLSDR